MGANQRERLWLFGGALVAFLVVLVGYFFFVSPQKGQTSDAKSQVADAQLRNTTLQHRISVLSAQNKNLASYVQQLQQAKLALPDTSGLPDFLRTLQSLGSSTLASVTSLTVGTPVEASPTAAAVPAAAGSASATPTVPSGGQAAQPASTVGKVYALPITVNVAGSYNQLDQFLSQLQSVQPRAVLISQISEATSTDGKQLTLALSMLAFVAPSSATEAAALSGASR